MPGAAEGTRLLYDEFKTAVQQLLNPAGAASSSLFPIPMLRRALAPRISAAEFDTFLCAMQRDGLIHLLTHVEAESLSEDDLAASLRHPSGVLAYWVCWA